MCPGGTNAVRQTPSPRPVIDCPQQQARIRARQSLGKQRRRGLRAGLWTALSLGCLVGCADDGPTTTRERQQVVRLHLVPAPGSPEPTGEVVSRGRFDVGPNSLAEWPTKGAAEILLERKDKRKGGPWAGICFTGELGRVYIPHHIEPNSVNRAAVRLVCRNKVDVAVALTRRGENVVISPFLRHSGDGSPAVVFLDLPGVLGETEPFDGIRVLCDRLNHASTFLSLELLSAPLSGFLPMDPEAPEPVGIDKEYRTAVTLSKDRPLEAEVVAPAGGTLKFGMARPQAVFRATDQPTVKVSVFDLEQEPARLMGESEFPMPTDELAEKWADVEIPVDLPQARKLKVEFSLNTDQAGESLAVLSSPRFEVRRPRSKTVVLVTSDTHRADHLGSSSRNVGVETPFLDLLAARGVMFEDAFSSINITNPSHASLLTALSPRDTHMVDNNTVLSEDAVTLAELYQQEGYFTVAALSAGHMNHRQSGLSQGFDRLWVPHGKSDVESCISIERLDRWLEEADGLPLFVWLHVFDAHAPYTVPEELRWRYYDKQKDPYDMSLPDLPEGARVPWDAGVRDLDFVTSQYMSEVTYLDTQLEGFLSHPRFGDAIIAITGDHGESFGNHGLYFTHNGLYPETLGVPLIVTWPDGPQGVVVTQGVSHLDLGRTLLDLSNLADVPFPGKNLLRWIGDDPEGETRFAVSSHGHSASIEKEGWYLVLSLDKSQTPKRVKHQVELFRLANDPGCLVDLVEEEFERARALRSELIGWLAAADKQGLSRATGLQSRDELERLKALGYAEGGDGSGGPSAGDDGGRSWYAENPENPWCRRFQ